MPIEMHVAGGERRREPILWKKNSTVGSFLRPYAGLTSPVLFFPGSNVQQVGLEVLVPTGDRSAACCSHGIGSAPALTNSGQL
jgi:hypothetical protein